MGDPGGQSPGRSTLEAVVTGKSDADVEAAVRQALDHYGVAYGAIPCDPRFADTAAFCQRYGVAPEDSANTIIVVGKAEPRRYVACVVLATTKLDVNGAVRRRLGVRKASFASSDETRVLTGMMIGGVTPFALGPGMPLWVDARVVERDAVVLGGGSRSLKVRLSPDVFRAMANAEIVPSLAVPAG